MYQNFVVKKEEHVTVVTINRPKVLNALNSDTLQELDQIITTIESDNDVRVVVLTGEGKAFVAGADIQEMSELSAEEGRSFGAFGQHVFKRLESLKQPVIAAVNGFALGGGCEIAMACDIRLASERAKFGQPEVGLGITPGFSGTQRLAKLVGTGQAKLMIYTGKIIRADEAKLIGLVDQVCTPETLIDEAMELAKSIAKNAPLAVQYAKTCINQGAEATIEVGNAIEESFFGLCFATEDQKNGMKAFLNKETYEFKGK